MHAFAANPQPHALSPAVPKMRAGPMAAPPRASLPTSVVRRVRSGCKAKPKVGPCRLSSASA